MAVLTESVSINYELVQKVERFAKQDERSRNEIIDEAIDRYVQLRELREICARVQRAAEENGITQEMIDEEIRLCKEERRRGL